MSRSYIYTATRLLPTQYNSAINHITTQIAAIVAPLVVSYSLTFEEKVGFSMNIILYKIIVDLNVLLNVILSKTNPCLLGPCSEIDEVNIIKHFRTNRSYDVFDYT